MQRKNDKAAWDPSDSAAYLLGRAARLFNKRADERMRKLGLGGAYVLVLRALHAGTPMSQTALAAFARIEQPTMAQLLARMERDGLVRRMPNPEDRRSSLFSLTEAAMRKIPSVRRVLEQGSDELLAGLTAAEVEQLAALLKRMIANIEDEETHSSRERR